MIDKDTRVCISVASRPSNFGTTIHNAAYRMLGLNYIYKGCGVNDLEGAIRGVRALGIRGCSVSMPFKQEVIPLLDDLDEVSREIGAVNTIVNESGMLCGYNTDVHGAKVALKALGIYRTSRILLLGAGGVARSIVFALREMGITDVAIANRTLVKSDLLVLGTGFKCISWDKRGEYEADVLINGTSIGMSPEMQLTPVRLDTLSHFDKVMDVVVSPLETLLIKNAIAMGKDVSRGDVMSLHQAAKQFELYTGYPAPLDVMRDSLNTLLAN